jgi:hypothetical protein
MINASSQQVPTWLTDEGVVNLAYTQRADMYGHTISPADVSPRVPGYVAIPRQLLTPGAPTTPPHDDGAILIASSAPEFSSCNGTEQSLAQCFRTQLEALTVPSPQAIRQAVPATSVEGRQLLVFACSNDTATGHTASGSGGGGGGGSINAKGSKDGEEGEKAGGNTSLLRRRAAAVAQGVGITDVQVPGTWVIGDRLPDRTNLWFERSSCSREWKAICTDEDAFDAAASLLDNSLVLPRVFTEVRARQPATGSPILLVRVRGEIMGSIIIRTD